MSVAMPGKSPLRCAHCGREVAETMHTRSSYRVDYYALHTGAVEPVTLSRGEDAPPMTVLKLLSANEVFTCADCYRQPRIRQERELLFRPELAAVPEQETVS
jgi:DNA-directed RNA polymerase subunit RPC12/RpoP